jgi:hypothetical protein
MQRILETARGRCTIWVALGMARDCFAEALRRQEYPEMSDCYRRQRDRMQVVRDEIEVTIERLKELEEALYG